MKIELSSVTNAHLIDRLVRRSADDDDSWSLLAVTRLEELGTDSENWVR